MLPDESTVTPNTNALKVIGLASPPMLRADATPAVVISTMRLLAVSTM